MELKMKPISMFIAIPTHRGHVHQKVMSSVLDGLKNQYNINTCVRGHSLLARNFNTLFADAWNGGFDFLAMLHSDLGVEAVSENESVNWLNHMVDVSQYMKAAVVSGVAAIKTPQGHTSTALNLRKDSPHVMRRLTIRELEDLPYDIIRREHLCELFDVDPDVAGGMFVNTGCMLMALNTDYAPDWTQWPGFEVSDQLVFNKAGKAASFCQPEDWNMSRWMFERGWRYYALRSVITEHYGETSFPNYGYYGDDFDPYVRPESAEEFAESTTPKKG